MGFGCDALVRVAMEIEYFQQSVVRDRCMGLCRNVSLYIFITISIC